MSSDPSWEGRMTIVSPAPVQSAHEIATPGIDDDRHQPVAQASARRPDHHQRLSLRSVERTE
jgi:hypothetical protein